MTRYDEDMEIRQAPDTPSVAPALESRVTNRELNFVAISGLTRSFETPSEMEPKTKSFSPSQLDGVPSLPVRGGEPALRSLTVFDRPIGPSHHSGKAETQPAAVKQTAVGGESPPPPSEKVTKKLCFEGVARLRLGSQADSDRPPAGAMPSLFRHRSGSSLAMMTEPTRVSIGSNVPRSNPEEPFTCRLGERDASVNDTEPSTCNSV